MFNYEVLWLSHKIEGEPCRVRETLVQWMWKETLGRCLTCTRACFWYGQEGHIVMNCMEGRADNLLTNKAVQAQQGGQLGTIFRQEHMSLLVSIWKDSCWFVGIVFTFKKQGKVTWPCRRRMMGTSGVES